MRFEHVDFSYEPKRQILFDVSFEIPAGHTVAVVGHSGSGKSTLSRLLFRFYDVNAGRISINGATSATSPSAACGRRIGIVPQDTVLFNDTIFYNIAYGDPDGHARGGDRSGARPRTSTTSSSRCPTSTTPRLVSAASSCRAARSSAWPSRAPSSRTRASSCSTKPPRRWTRAPRRRSRPSYDRIARSAPPWSSRTGCRRSWTPIRSW